MIERLLAGGGLAAALGASTCCVLPMSFAALGLGGASLAVLDGLASWRTPFAIVAILLLGAGFWRLYAAAPTNGAACAPAPRRMTKAALWAGAVLVGLVLTSGWWQPFVA